MEDILKAKNFSYKKFREIYLLVMVFLLACRYFGVYSLAPLKIDEILFSGLALCGVIILSFGVLLNDIDFNLKQNKWLFLFLTVFLVSSFLNCTYGILGNLKSFIWTLIAFCVIFISPKNYSLEERKKLIITIQNILICFWLALSLLSILIFISGINYEDFIPGRSHEVFRLGYLEARLFGVFTNPNRGSSVAFLTIIFSFFRLFENKKRLFKNKLHITNIIIQSIYISLANSRGTLFAALITCGFSLYIFLEKNKLFDFFILSFLNISSLTFKKIYKITMCLCAVIIFCSFIYFIDLEIRNVFSYIPPFTEKLFVRSMGNSSTILNKIQGMKIQVMRMDFVDNGDISNLRFGIWGNSWKIFKSNWLFGVSPANVLNYAKTFFPFEIIAMRKYSRIHNAYFDTLLCTGVLGFITIGIFYLKNIFKIFKYYVQKNLYNNDNIFHSCNAAIMFVIIYGLFESEILFVNTLCSFVFWSFLSFSLVILQEKTATPLQKGKLYEN